MSGNYVLNMYVKVLFYLMLQILGKKKGEKGRKKEKQKKRKKGQFLTSYI